jgi:DNA polymerase-3 subunit epsilon
MAKLLFIDFETTGTNHWQHCIHQIAGIIKIHGVEKERFEFKVKPHPAGLIEDAALAVSGVTRETLASAEYFTQKEVYTELVKMLEKYVDKFNSRDKYYVIAYNGASFDMNFFRAFFKQCGDNYFGSWFWSACIDPMILAAQYFLEDRKFMENFKQSTVAKQFDIVVDEARLHDAVYDVEIMIQIYEYMYPVLVPTE